MHIERKMFLFFNSNKTNNLPMDSGSYIISYIWIILIEGAYLCGMCEEVCHVNVYVNKCVLLLTIF